MPIPRKGSLDTALRQMNRAIVDLSGAIDDLDYQSMYDQRVMNVVVEMDDIVEWLKTYTDLLEKWWYD